MATAARSSSRASGHLCWSKSSLARSTRCSASYQSFMGSGAFSGPIEQSRRVASSCALIALSLSRLPAIHGWRARFGVELLLYLWGVALRKWERFEGLRKYVNLSAPVSMKCRGRRFFKGELGEGSLGRGQLSGKKGWRGQD